MKEAGQREFTFDVSNSMENIQHVVELLLVRVPLSIVIKGVYTYKSNI